MSQAGTPVVYLWPLTEPPPIPSNAANLTPWTKSNFLAVGLCVGCYGMDLMNNFRFKLTVVSSARSEPLLREVSC